MARTARINAGALHRRLKRINPRSVGILLRKDGNGIDYTASISGCPTCVLGKSQSKTHPKQAVPKTT